jgi:hypothetical protein
MKIFFTGKFYKLTVKIENQISYYNAKILDEDDFDVKFLDKKGKTLTIKKEYIISSEEKE